MKELCFVFVGGGLGSVMRYIVSLIWQHISLHPRFSQCVLPWPTLVVNVLGCLAISLVCQNSERWGLSPETRLLLTTGLCGGFTTFSTFSYEGLTLLRSGYTFAYILYVCLSVTLGLLAASLPVVLKA
ncbi:MAG: fluoride efflux transporter CrcB [Prevotella sp.]